MSKPKIPPSPHGFSVWKPLSSKDVHVQYFPYIFKRIEEKHVKNQEEPVTERDREFQKFVYDVQKRELTVTYSGHMQTCAVGALVKMMQESIKDVPNNDDRPQFHTNTVSYLFSSPGEQKERYRIVGDVLVTTDAGPVFAIETATRHSHPSIREKVKKWFLLPSVSSVLLVHLNEGPGYRKPVIRPQEGDVFLINSWAWLNFVVDISKEKIDLFNCSEPVVYDEQLWVGPMACVLELYERDLSSKSACGITKRYEFIVPGRDFELEDSDERRAFQTRFFQAWEEAVEGTSLEGFRPFGFDWRRLAQVVAKTRLELAYERYKIWFQKHETDTSSALGKRRRDDSVDSKTQEVFLGSRSVSPETP